MNEQDIATIARTQVKKALAEHGVRVTTPSPQPTTLTEAVRATVSKVKKVLSEAVILSLKTYTLKTEYQSKTTKENHFTLYKSLVDSFNKVSIDLDSVSRDDTENNPNNSEFRRLKVDEQHNLNGVKLHELYFSNISDLHSEIRVDSTPFMRLSRDWGDFANWQFDFRACGMASREGWAVLYFDPFKQRYLNTFLEGHTESVPVMGIPVLVIDTWHHAWFKDYPGDKVNYLNAMMKEINWSVVEARMLIAEMAQLQKLYMIEPIGASEPTRVISVVPSNQPPIAKDQVVNSLGV